MKNYKVHMINIHNKEKHNWMVEEVKTVFACDECKLDISDRSTLENHMHNIHSIEALNNCTPAQPYNVKTLDTMQEP